MKIVYIMCGIPGSGKSYTVNQIKQYYESKNVEVIICSSDHFMMNDKDEYDFHPSKLAYTHRKCQEKFCNALSKENIVVIVDNTNVKIRDLRYYEKAALDNSFKTIIVESNSDWKDNPEYCAKMNTHNVPYDKIKEMYNSLLHTRKVLEDEKKKIYSSFEEIINV